VNTIWIDRNEEHDALADVTDMHTWARATGERCGLIPAIGSAEDVSTDAAAHLIDPRDALRRLAAERTQDPRSLGQSPVPDGATATSIVNTASAMSTVWPELLSSGQTSLRRDVATGGSFADALTTMIAQALGRQSMGLFGAAPRSSRTCMSTSRAPLAVLVDGRSVSSCRCWIAVPRIDRGGEHVNC
jgi:hypothetical protein